MASPPKKKRKADLTALSQSDDDEVTDALSQELGHAEQSVSTPVEIFKSGDKNEDSAANGVENDRHKGQDREDDPGQTNPSGDSEDKIYRRKAQDREDDPGQINPSSDSEDKWKSINECFKNRNNCPFDGRLRRLEKKEVKMIKAFCTDYEIKKGRFAEFDDFDNDSKSSEKQCVSVVYFSGKDLPGLNVRVALKKITMGDVSDSSKEYINYSFKNEEIAARIRHFAVAPVFAKYEDPNGRKLYLLSAFMDYGDLQDVLKDPILDDLKQRLRILFQIASAILFLHTPVAIYRKALLHLDIKSSNIGLDGNLNARLIDFGLAREIEGDEGIKCPEDTFDVKYIGTPGYFPTNPVRRLTKHLDYFSLGVVMRETITGANPGDPCTKHKFWLRNKQTLCECLWEQIKSKWKTTSDSKRASSIEKIAKNCISSWAPEGKETFKFEKEYDTLEDLVRHDGYRNTASGVMPNESDSAMCEMCLVNKASKDNEDMVEHELSCKTNIKLCMQCVKSNYLNPVKCHSCNKCKPKIGGHNTACISIAGDGAGQKIYEKDATDFLEILCGKAHHTVCVRKLKNSQIKPSAAKSSMAQLGAALDEVNESSGIDTLILYFSGHGDKDKGLQLNKELKEYMCIQHLSDMLKKMLKKKQLRKIYIFFDCCHPPILTLPFTPLPTGVQIIQYCSSRPDQESSAGDGTDYSMFTSFLLGAILRKHKCLLTEKLKNEDCKLCIKYWQKCEKKDYLKIDKIFANVRKHMKKMGNQQPTGCIVPYATNEEIFSFSSKSTVSMQLKIVRENLNENLVHVDLNFFATLDSIRTDVFRKWLSSDWENAYAGYADVLSVKNGTLPSDLTNTNDLLHVWNSKQLLDVTLRSYTGLRTGRVGLFPRTSKFGGVTCVTGKKLKDIVDNAQKIKSDLHNNLEKIKQSIHQAQNSGIYIGLVRDLVSLFDVELGKFEKSLRVLSSFRIIEDDDNKRHILIMNGEDFCSHPFIFGSDGGASVLVDIARHLRCTEIPSNFDIVLYIPKANIDFVCLELVRKDTMVKQDYVFYGDMSKICRAYAMHREF
ncbi:uncharacterized protein LOC128205556 [Mya arenaria]|uniref:uncharacterized protein LOC128205556 n=1 Tax=Mya arenaria TaxID=6604 RepID=UPI0022E4CC49|nr:uncharacterized protein LOC128205556 [Mya arenaria]